MLNVLIERRIKLTSERADSSVVSAGGGQPAHRGSIPVGSNPGVARGYFPTGDRAGVYVCGCVCVRVLPGRRVPRLL